MKIALIAGETSGDQLGGWLMESLGRAAPGISFVGIGGDNMQAQGLQSLFPMQEIALMGFLEILPHALRLKRRIRETIEFIEREKPNVLVTIDSPGFNFRVVKGLRARGKVRPRFIHYVAPSVWVYKPRRAAKTAALYDQLLTLLPFEPPYFEKEGLKTDFIGHEIAWQWRTKGDGAAFRKRHGIGDAPLLVIFPGSRHGELNRMLPILGETVKELQQQVPDLRIAVQVPEALKIRLDVETASWPAQTLVLSSNEEKKDLFAVATVALAKSGTIGLECVLAGLPAVITYRGNPVSIWLVRRMASTTYANIANYMLKREVVPELIQEGCTPQRLVPALLSLLKKKAARDAQISALAPIPALLGANDAISPSDKAAKVILNGF